MKPILAGKYVPEKVEKLLPVYAQLKFDGIRVFIRDGVAYTRSLKPVRSEQIQSMVANNKSLEGYDGELICGDPAAHNCYQRTMSSVMAFNQPDDDVRFYLFDKWDEPNPFKLRLLTIIDDSEMGRLPSWAIPAETLLMQTIEEIDDYMMEKFAEGHEGIILRNPESFYKYGRGTPTQCELIKVKDGRWIDTEGVVIGKREEMENTNDAEINALGYTERKGGQAGLVGKGSLGSVQVRGTFGTDDLIPAHVRGTDYECSIGSGFDAAQREELWQEDLTGRIVKFKFFTSGIKDRPRFPIFIGWRDPDDMDPGAAEQMNLFDGEDFFYDPDGAF